MTMGTIPLVEYCRDCQHWQEMTEDFEMGTFGEGVRQGHCELTFSDSGDARRSESKAVAQDYEAYRAWLCTREDFGCIQWERKS